MRRDTFDLRIRGPRDPSAVSLGDLTAFLECLQETVLSYVCSRSLDVPETMPLMSLVAIRTGSEELGFSVPAEVIPAVAHLSTAVERERYEDLPPETHRKLYELSELVVGKTWELEFLEDAKHGIRPAQICANHPVQKPEKPAEVHGTTSLLAQCLRVGGVEPKAEVRLPSSGKLFYPRLTKDIARELAKRLYETVVLEGRATWRTDTWEVIDFQVTSISSYRPSSPNLAFEKLAQAAQGRWDDVDALEYVRDLR